MGYCQSFWIEITGKGHHRTNCSPAWKKIPETFENILISSKQNYCNVYSNKKFKTSVNSVISLGPCEEENGKVFIPFRVLEMHLWNWNGLNLPLFYLSKCTCLFGNSV